jgi:hypothetical protein
MLEPVAGMTTGKLKKIVTIIAVMMVKMLVTQPRPLRLKYRSRGKTIDDLC